VDRVFTVAGFGHGRHRNAGGWLARAGQEVVLLPRGQTARVRGLQTHKKKIERAVPGSRVAVNLSGVELSDVHRSDTLTTPGWLTPTMLIDVRLQLLADAPHPLKHDAEVKLFHGAAEVTAQTRLLATSSLRPARKAGPQFRLSEPLNVVKGDRFIVRLPSPSLTLGGGLVVDPHPATAIAALSREVIAHLETLARGSPAEILLAEPRRAGPMSWAT